MTDGKHERDTLMATGDKALARIWLAIFSEVAEPLPGKITGAVLSDEGTMETVVASHWTAGGRTQTRRQLIDRIVDACLHGP